MTHTTQHRNYTITTVRHAVRSWDITISDAPWATESYLDQPTLGECFRKAKRLGVDPIDLWKHATAREKEEMQ